MAEIHLLRGSYRTCAVPFMQAGTALDARVEAYVAAIADQVEETLGSHAGAPPDQHFLCSTLLDVVICNHRYGADVLLKRIARRTAHAPTVLVNAYECAAWAFILRYAHHGRVGPIRVACTIVDLNLLDLEFWNSSPHWGRSGYGIAVLLFEIRPSAACWLTLGRAKTSNMMAEFAIAVRTAIDAEAGGRARVALPMFPEPTSKLFDRLLPRADRIEDAHAQLGHCFGSDPWVLIMKDLALRGPHETVLACSVALNGYWAIGRVSTDANTSVRLLTIP